jgi:hypothetical protein
MVDIQYCAWYYFPMLNNTNRRERTMHEPTTKKIKNPIEVTRKADILLLNEVMRNGSLIGVSPAALTGGDYIG